MLLIHTLEWICSWASRYACWWRDDTLDGRPRPEKTCSGVGSLSSINGTNARVSSNPQEKRVNIRPAGGSREI
jgi:hypothetical protein